MFSLRALAVWTGCLLICISTAVAEETVTVDLGRDGGEIRHRASGFLHGFSDDGQLPPDSMIAPLRVQVHRTRPGTTWAQAERMKKLGIQQQVVVSDGWGYSKAHPGDDGQWANWEDFVTHIVQEAQRRGLNPQWDIWNEPDHHFFWKRSPEQFHETWRRAYAKIRESDPAAVIVGPSWSGVHPGQPRFTAFIRFCKHNNVVPDYVCWHFPRDMVKEADECRKLLNAEQIRVKGLMVNEYCLANEQYAGKTAWLIAQVERAKIDLSCHAIWGNEGKGNLDGILDDPRKSVPKGQWWACQRYAALPGRLIATTPGGKIDLVGNPADRAEGGYIRAMHYGYTTPTPEGVNVFSGNGQELHMLKNLVISGNVIRPYSSDGKNRIPSTGIRVCGAENSQIFNNVVFDSGNHRGLIVASTKKVKPSVICRDNYNGDNTLALPRDDKGN